MGTGRGLTTARIKAISKPGKYYDQDQLYLNVKASLSASWVLRYTINGRERYMGLGPLSLVSLTEARGKALTARKLILDGGDPLAVQTAARAAEAPLFRQIAEEVIKDRSSRWKNPKGVSQWQVSLETYVYPLIGALPVSEVGDTHIFAILRPIWSSKVTTASRIRNRVEIILNYAKTKGHRSGDNPARWVGHLENVFAPKNEVHKVRHFRAMPYKDIPALMKRLKEADCTGSRALEFLILNGSRTGEVIGGTKSELDRSMTCWTIQGTRMKGRRQHRVPLSVAAVSILKRQLATVPDTCPFLFNSRGGNQPLSNAAMYVSLKRMGYDDITVHGFRSAFRDWAAEMTSFPREVVEMALAHSIVKGVEAAYLRSDFFDKRRKLMTAWAAFCTGKRQKNISGP